MAIVAEKFRTQDADAAAALLSAHCEPLPSLDEAERFAAFFDRFADAKLVLLGEASHGTSQFYRARAAITRRLIEKHGFNIVAVEADWPDAARIDRYVRFRAHEASPDEAFSRFPTWMWRNVEVHDFIEWLRRHNGPLPVQERAEFRGLDIYSLGNSIAAVLAYLDRVDPEEARAARKRYGCLTPWQDDPAAYGLSAIRLGKSPCEDAVVAELRALARQAPRLCQPRRRVLLKRRAERARGARGGTLLSADVPQLARILEPARPPHVRYARAAARAARRRREGSRVGA